VKETCETSNQIQKKKVMLSHITGVDECYILSFAGEEILFIDLTGCTLLYKIA
jgi:hypothetical protein